jgi:hypothetical protein
MNPWFWELRSDGEFLPPEIANFGEGWHDWKGPLQSSPPVGAEIFARELVQNFVDAARDHRHQNPDLSSKPKLVFEFHEFTGKQGRDLREKLGLNTHRERFDSLSVDEKNNLRIGNSRVLQGDTDLLKMLVVKESYTTGMSGQWEMTDRVTDDEGKKIIRKMRSAFLSSVGQRNLNGLGAYGEGKRAVIGASVPRIMLAYTCFQKQKITGQITRRFLGVTYWRPHEEITLSGGINEAKSATGLAMWGSGNLNGDRTHAGRPSPLEDEQADLLICDLAIPGVELRSPEVDADFGTTMIFVEPSFTAEDVKWALERNWWPLIVDEEAELFVTDTDGVTLPINPESRPELKLFIENYKILKNSKLGFVRDENGHVADPISGLIIQKDNVVREDLVEELRCSSTGQDVVGTLGLSIDCSMGGWSYKDRDTNWTIVALVRDGMIIEYEPFPRQRQGSTPFVRGVFVTNSDKNKKPCELLRTAEPPLHNHWVEKSDAFDAGAVKLAKELYLAIGASVKDFRKQYSAKPEPSNGEFEEFGEAFGEDEDDNVQPQPPKPSPPLPPQPPKPSPPLPPQPPTPPKTKDPWENISGDSRLDQNVYDPDLIRAFAVRKLKLKQGWKDDTLPVVITLGWGVREDDNFSNDNSLLDDAATLLPPGFTQIPTTDGTFQCEGTLTKDSYAEITIVSKFYDYLWSVRPFSVVEQKSPSDGDS